MVMKLIEHVDYREMDGHTCDIVRRVETADPYNCMTETETVRGERFRRWDGQIVIIGMTKQVRDLLGLPLDAFRMQDGYITEHRETIKYLRRALDDFEQMTRWQRFLFLFRSPRRIWS